MKFEQPHRCTNCDALICEKCWGIYLQQGCHPIARTLDLALAHPEEGVSLSRGRHGEVLGRERQYAEAIKPYPGITVPDQSETPRVLSEGTAP